MVDKLRIMMNLMRFLAFTTSLSHRPNDTTEHSRRPEVYMCTHSPN